MRGQSLTPCRRFYPGFVPVDEHDPSGWRRRGGQQERVIASSPDARGGARCKPADTVRFEPLQVLQMVEPHGYPSRSQGSGESDECPIVSISAAVVQRDR